MVDPNEGIDELTQIYIPLWGFKALLHSCSQYLDLFVLTGSMEKELAREYQAEAQSS